MHIHAGNLTVFIGNVVIDSSIRITAGGVICNLIFFFPHTDAAPRLENGTKNMKKLADAF